MEAYIDWRSPADFGGAMYPLLFLGTLALLSVSVYLAVNELMRHSLPHYGCLAIALSIDHFLLVAIHS